MQVYANMSPAEKQEINKYKVSMYNNNNSIILILLHKLIPRTDFTPPMALSKFAFIAIYQTTPKYSLTKMTLILVVNVTLSLHVLYIFQA